MRAIRTTVFVARDEGLELRGEAHHPPDPRGIAVLLHGIPSSAPADPSDEGYPGLARRFAERGWLAVWADMRGARASPGFFSIEGWVRDARAIVDRARALHGGRELPVVLVGSSAGGAVSVEAVARGAPVDALVLLAAPAEWLSFDVDAGEALRRITEDAGMAVAPDVHLDPREWASEFLGVVPEHSIAAVRVPVLIVHGTADEVVPVAHASRLARRSNDAEIRIIEGADHSLRRREGSLEIVIEWLERKLSWPHSSQGS
jgi:uncharacterized protein